MLRTPSEPRDSSRAAGTTRQSDTCVDNSPIGIGDTPFSNVDAGTDGPWPCGYLGAELWYGYDADFTGDLVVSLCGSSYDTVLAVYDGCTCPPAQVDLLDFRLFQLYFAG